MPKRDNPNLIDFTMRLSPVSQLVFQGFLIMWWVVFRLTFWDFAVFLIVDTLALVLVALADRKLLTYLFPDFSLFFPKLDIERAKTLSVEERVKLFEALVKFPARRASYISVMSYLKAVPAGFLAVMMWEHDIPDSLQLAKFLGVVSALIAYFSGAVFIESHKLVSAAIAKLHDSHDWSEVFSRVDPAYYKADFHLQEMASLVVIWIFMLTVQWLVITTSGPVSNLALALRSGGVGIIGLAAISRIWYLGRSYFMGGLDSVFNHLERFDPSNPPRPLPLHSSSLLGRFEKTYNSLVSRLKEYQSELSHWLFVKTEQSRYQALGEISALIVHDLSNPLHVLHFCTQQLKENPQLANESRYIEQMVTNGQRSLELVTSLRSYLRHTPANGQSHFREVFTHAMKLLETRFYYRGFHRVVIETEPSLENIQVNMATTEFLHVLLNILANSIENMLTHEVPGPKIRIYLAGDNDGARTFGIEDNGTGLSPEKFEAMTAMVPLMKQDGANWEGLGLRLVRRLLERNGGTLAVASPRPDRRGTTFLLTLSTGRDVESDQV